MSVSTKQIAVFAKNGAKKQLVTVQNYGVDANLTGITLSLEKDEMLGHLATLGERLKEMLGDECKAIYHEANKLGHGETFKKFLDTLDVDLGAKIPSVFTRELRCRIGGMCMKMRTLMTTPEKSLKGALTKTSQGYWLELWFLDESLSVYKDLVEPIYAAADQEQVGEVDTPVQPVTSEIELVLESTTPVTIAAEEEVLLSSVPVCLIHPLNRPTVQAKAMTAREASLKLANQGGLRFF